MYLVLNLVPSIKGVTGRLKVGGISQTRQLLPYTFLRR